MLMRSLSAIVRSARIYSNRNLKMQNISSAEHSILMFLYSQDYSNQEDIANYFMLDKGSISKTLHNLETKGLIIRYENPNNHREKVISLTSLGKDNMSKMYDLLKDWNNELFEGIDEDEIIAFKKTVLKMEDNAKKAININATKERF